MSRKLLKIISVFLVTALLISSGWVAPVAKAVEPTSTRTVYHETFANGKGVAKRSGGANLETVTGKVFAGNDDGATLYVSNRTNNYDAADFDFSDIGLVNGETYTATVTVYIDEDMVVPTGAQAYLQTISSYALLANANYEAGKAITLTKEFTVDTSKDTKLRIQSNDAGATVPFYVGDVLITQQTEDLESTTITFEDQTSGGFTGRAGTETLTVTNEANHTNDGSYALKVEGRSSNWHGPSLHIEDFVSEGYEYKISAWVKLIEPTSSQLQLSTQVGNGSSANYVSLAPKTINASDDWVQFEGTYRYSNTSSNYLTIYIESSNNSTASFYIDDVSITNTGSGLIEIEKDLTPLNDVYANDFLIGNAISAEDLLGVRLDLLKMHHEVATAGNAMKPDAMQPTKGNFTFGAANALVDKVLAEGLQMHGHVLVWHQQSPAWMNTTTDGQNNTVPLEREEALDNLRTHIRTVMENFGDKVISWDVVNEAMNDNPSNPNDWENSLRQSSWYNAIGPDYVEQSFLAAREVLDDHPEWGDIKLYYNDYNEDNQNKAQAIYSMIKEINDNYALTHPGKLLIGGMGMQGHYNVNTNPENVKLSLEKFISLGVEVSITELDIQAGSNHQLSDKQANDQGYLYAQLFNLFKAHKDDIARVTFWGLDDNTSWRASTNPLLFDKNLQAKPAYYAVIDPDTFISEHNPELSNANQGIAKFATPTIDGTVDGVWTQASEMQINRYQMAWQGATGVAKALWDNEYLYLLIQVSDAQLDNTSGNVWEHDSVEVFVDENNEKTSFYQEDDGQFRINYDNETSFNPTSIADGFESATNVSGTNYTVEVKISLKSITPANNTKLGFDVQINDAKAGARQSVAAWNDTTGTGYMDTSVYGELTLTGKPDSSNNNNNNVTPPSTGNVENKDGIIVIKPVVKNDEHRITGIVSADNLKTALELASSGTNAQKSIVIDISKQANAISYDVQLPTQSLQSQVTYTLSVKTELATIELPSNMLANTTVNEEHVSIRVAHASIDHLDAVTRERIGNHPVLDLSLIAGNKIIPWNNPNAPVTITIPYTPTAEELSNPNSIVVWYIDDSGNVITIPNGRYDATTKSVVFQTTHFSNYAVAYVVKTFEDLNNVPWAKQAIDVMAARDVIKGTSESNFSPADSITRADFIALLVRALELQGNGKNEVMFSDVSVNAHYYNELVIAKELAIVTGYGDNTFKPNEYITRQDMMVLASRALSVTGKQLESSGTIDAFSDAQSVATYAKDDIAKLVKLAIVDGKNGKIAPHDSLTRAEAAVILYRIWNL